MSTKTKNITPRKFFIDRPTAIEMPDLIEVQKDSYRWFLEEGIRDLFDEVSPVQDFIGRNLELYFEDYYLDEPKFTELESKAKNITFEAPLRVKARLFNKQTTNQLLKRYF